MRLFTFSLAAFSLLSLSGCPNIFDPLDSPSGEAQLLSAARACFDKGDLNCALDHYAKLPDNQYALAESAFAVMDDVGLGIREFAAAIGEGRNNPGLLLTRLVEEATPYATEANRVRLATAYQNVARITIPELRGLTKFMLAMGMTALNFADHTGISGDRVFHKNDIAANGAVCGDTNVVSLPLCNQGGNACDPSLVVGSDIAADHISDDTNMDTDPANATMSGPASWRKIFVSINAANAGLSEMGVDTGSSFRLINQMLSFGVSPSTNLPCFRHAIMTTGIGR